MRLLLIATALIAMLVGGLLAVSDAQEAADGPTPAWIADAGPGDVAAPVAAEPAPVAAEPTPADLLKDAAEIKRAYDELKSAKGGKVALWMGLLAAIALTLLHGLKLYIKARVPKSDRWKRWLPRIAGLLGIAVGFFEAYTGSVVTAILYGLAPPLAVWINEIWSTSKGEK